MPTIPPLETELRDAIALLRKHHMYRAALRLEKASARVLDAKRPSKPAARRVQLVTASGKTIKLKLHYEHLPIEDQRD